MGDPARANMLCALKNQGALTATELAHVAGVAPSTASEHLAKLTRARMIAVQRQGRHRYYRLAGDEVADALESLEALAVTAAPRHRPRAPHDDSIRFAQLLRPFGRTPRRRAVPLADPSRLPEIDRGRLRPSTKRRGRVRGARYQSGRVARAPPPARRALPRLERTATASEWRSGRRTVRRVVRPGLVAARTRHESPVRHEPRTPGISRPLPNRTVGPA